MNGPDGALLILVKRTTRLIMAAAGARRTQPARCGRAGPYISGVSPDCLDGRWADDPDPIARRDLAESLQIGFFVGRRSSAVARR